MDLQMLRQIIHSKGLNNLKMAQLLKISPTAFHNKMKGSREFKDSEIRGLKEVLELDDEVMCILLFGDHSGGSLNV